MCDPCDSVPSRPGDPGAASAGDLHLVDGHSLTFKAYYAIRGLTNPKGRPTGAAYGFVRMLLKLIDVLGSRRLAVVFDTGRPTFRKDLYPAYKANRVAPPEDFGEQMGWIQRFLHAARIATYQLEGYEADDLLATMSEQAELQRRRSLVYTADKDLFQLVDDWVTVARPGTGNEPELFDAARVAAHVGVRPDQMTDWLALVGDSSDNVPGVPGIGPKTATALLAEYGSLEELLKRAGEMKNARLAKNLLDHADQARLAHTLVTVRRDVPLEWNLEDCHLPANPWNEQVVRLLVDEGFQSILKERGLEAPKAARAAAVEAPDMFAQAEPVAQAKTVVVASDAEEVDYQIVMDESVLRDWVTEALRASWLAIDTETTSTDALRGKLVGISLSHRQRQAIYIPVGHQAQATPGPQLALDFVRQTLRPLLAGKGPRLAAHHAKFDWKVLATAGMELVDPAFDTNIASYLLDPDKASGHGLKALGRELCGVEMHPIRELIGSGKHAITMAEVAVGEAGPYACRDADVTLRLTELLRPRLAEVPSLAKLMEEVELPLVRVLMDMERGGFAVDVERLRRLGARMREALQGSAQTIWEQVGHPFNIGSPKQVARVLFEELGLKPGREGRMGYSTDVAELERLAATHPVAQLILEYRGYEKLQSTYADALPQLVNSKTGRIHTSFHQAIAATGRLSSTDPNLQNIPIRSEMGREIRGAFIADSAEHVLVKADYSQIELRILAHVSQDPTLRAAYHEGLDIHRQTASQLFGVELRDVTGQMRSQAKTINFGIIYGMSPHGLAQQLGIGRAEAGRFIDRYFATYPGVRRWIDRLLERARVDGFVETLLGRRRWVPDLAARNGQIRSAAERVAVNTPIQGTCADVIKLAMIRVHEGLGRVAPGARMVCQVHDELVLTTPRERHEEVGEFVRRAMSEALPLSVPVEVDVSSGANWAEC